jgi:3',5'-cyclic AMP phosphodiesterase CpdA
MVNQFITPGNHEYSDDDHGPVVLAPQFSTQFAALQNGPDGLKSTVYFSRYQGVLLISLNSTAAVSDEAQAKLQADWLKQVLTQQFASPAKPSWVVVTFHHPMFSVSEGRDNARLRQYWQPVFNQFPVDLVLQGHDHTYGRFSDRLSSKQPSSQSGSQPNNQSSSLIKGPVYLVSVAGPKMYLSSKQAQNQMQRLAEDTQLFQLIDFKQDRLQYQARTATGELYDAFVLSKTADGQRQIADEAPVAGKLPATRYCQTPLNERLKPTRCWNGTEFNLPQLQPIATAAK